MLSIHKLSTDLLPLVAPLLLADEWFAVSFRVGEAGANVNAGAPNVAQVKYSSLRFNAAAQRYIDSKGRFLDARAVRATVDADIAKTQDRMRTVSQALRDKQITLTDWRARMAGEVKSLHLAEVAAAKGGIHQMGAEEWGRAGERVRFHLEALNGFAHELSQNPALIDEKQPDKMEFLQRVELYAEAGRNTYERQKREEHDGAGFTHEQSLRGKTDSCDDCIAAAERGRVPIGTLPVPGDRSCGPKCGCEMTYMMEDDNNEP